MITYTVRETCGGNEKTDRGDCFQEEQEIICIEVKVTLGLIEVGRAGSWNPDDQCWAHQVVTTTPPRGIPHCFPRTPCLFMFASFSFLESRFST